MRNQLIVGFVFFLIMIVSMTAFAFAGNFVMAGLVFAFFIMAELHTIHDTLIVHFNRNKVVIEKGEQE